MKKRLVILNAVLLVLFLGVVKSQNAQDVPTSENADQLRRMLAISLLRQINTAEAVDQSTYGSYSSWQPLLAHNPEYFDKFIAMHRQQLPDAHFADAPGILPGWNLRLNVHPDGQGYDVLLEDATDKNGYAVLSDERVVIRECKWLH
jgi:hypothetical protein